MMFLLAPKEIYAAKQSILSYSTHLHLNTITFSYMALTVFFLKMVVNILVSFQEAPEVYLFGVDKVRHIFRFSLSPSTRPLPKNPRGWIDIRHPPIWVKLLGIIQRVYVLVLDLLTFFPNAQFRGETLFLGEKLAANERGWNHLIKTRTSGTTRDTALQSTL